MTNRVSMSNTNNDFMQIKRYVMEFANDTIRQDKGNAFMRPEIRKRRRARIEEIVRLYKSFRITTTEAIQCILEVGTGHYNG